MRDQVSIWTVANEAVWAHGAAAPTIVAQKAEALLAKGDHSDAVAMRLLADACQTIVGELLLADRRAG